MHPLILSRWLLVGYAVVSLLVLGVLDDRFASGMPAHLLLLLGPTLALLAALAAVRRLPPGLSTTWLLIAGSAAAALSAQLAGGLVTVAGARGAQAFLFLSSATLLAVGLAWQLHARERERGLEILADTALLVTAAVLVTLQWAPGARAVLAGAGPLDLLLTVAVLGTPIAAGCAILFALVLAAHYGAGWVTFALIAGAVGVALATVPLAAGGSPCCVPGDPAGVAYVLAWTALALAGATTAATPALAQAGAGGHRLRLLVAPAVAIIGALVVLDAAWRPPLGEATAGALGVVGLLLALRVSQLLYATHRLGDERQELAQTRMLVDVSRTLAGTTDLQTTLQVVTGWTRRLLDARSAAIELLDDSGEWLDFRAVDGLPLDAMRLRSAVSHSFSGSVVREGRARATADPRLEPDVAPESLAYLGKSPLAAAPLRYHDEILGVLSCIGTHPFAARELELLGALADQAAVAIQNARLFTQVHTLSVTDPLTGLTNRRQLARDLAREFAAARRGRRLVAIMFDLNGFKEYNDRFGHLAGDEALKLFADVLATETRAMNLAARYGGDEFLTLLADTDRKGAETFIERLAARFPGPDAPPGQRELSVCAGLAEYSPDMATPEDLVEAADRALYAAKSGRRAVITS